MKWYALFSHTGSEIGRLSDALGREPDCVLTNNPNDDQIDGMLDHTFMTHNEIESFLKQNVQPDDLVTLHGYMRILSSDVCQLDTTILNGHPAPIHLYPELKGMDQQEELYFAKDAYPYMGTVIHKVSAELDSGDILYHNDAPNTIQSVSDAYDKLKTMSFKLWRQCLEDLL